MHCWRRSSANTENKVLWQLSSYKRHRKWRNFSPVPKQSIALLIKESEWAGCSFSEQNSFPGEFPKLDCLKSCYFLCFVILIWTVCTLCTTALTSTLQIPPPKLLYLDIGNNFKGDGCKIEGVHCKIHQIPPVMYVLIESTIPHFLDFSPDETCRKKGSSLPWQGIICH